MKISAVIPDELGRSLEQRARLEDRSASSVVRIALAEFLSCLPRGGSHDQPGPPPLIGGSGHLPKEEQR